MPEPFDQPVSHVDLYHKLGRLEAMMENVMTAVSSFQTAVKDLHSRIDTIEEKQRELEAATSASKGATGAISTLFKDFAIPIVAIGLTWYITTGEKKEIEPHKHVPPQPLAIIRADKLMK